MSVVRVVRPDLLAYLESQGFLPVNEEGEPWDFDSMTDLEKELAVIAGWEEPPEGAEERGVDFGAFFNSNMAPLIGQPVTVFSLEGSDDIDFTVCGYTWKLTEPFGAHAWRFMEDWFVPAGEEA